MLPLESSSDPLYNWLDFLHQPPLSVLQSHSTFSTSKVPSFPHTPGPLHIGEAGLNNTLPVITWLTPIHPSVSSRSHPFLLRSLPWFFQHQLRFTLFYFIDFTERGRRGRDWFCCSTYLCIHWHSLVYCCVCLNWGLNPQSWHIQMML